MESMRDVRRCVVCSGLIAPCPDRSRENSARQSRGSANATRFGSKILTYLLLTALDIKQGNADLLVHLLEEVPRKHSDVGTALARTYLLCVVVYINNRIVL